MIHVCGSRLAISDVAVAAVCCKAALQGCSLNVLINTKFMKKREVADEFNARVDYIVSDSDKRLDEVYSKIQQGLR